MLEVPLVAFHMEEAEELAGGKARALSTLEGARCLGAAASGTVAAMVVDLDLIVATQAEY